MATSAAWDFASGGSPAVAGVTVEWVPVKQFSLALERVGWTSSAPGVGAWGLGGRGNWNFLQGDKLRPSLFVAAGLRYQRSGTAPSNPLTPTVGGGGMFRWYVTPRYFVEWEGRLETDGGPPLFLMGGGLGVHFGG